MAKHLEALRWLQSAYEEPLTGRSSDTALNTRLRRSLRQHAAAVRLPYAQDKYGNIYITRTGRDEEVPSIALTFPLDGGLDSPAFAGAFGLFSLLANEDLACSLSLVGWTSIGHHSTGRDAWHASVSLNVLQSAATKSVRTEQLSSIEMEQFAGLPDATEFPLSAIFEVVDEAKSEVLNISGDTVMVNKAKQHANDHSNLQYYPPRKSRAPECRITGLDAERVARAAICDYSDYVVALFDNFD